jgi:hypothetical protein
MAEFDIGAFEGDRSPKMSGWEALDYLGTVNRETFTTSSNVAASTNYVEINANSIGLTISDSLDHLGSLFIVTKTFGASVSTITLTSGTWDGTNNIAVLRLSGDKIVVHFDLDGDGSILSNIGAVTFS